MVWGCQDKAGAVSSLSCWWPLEVLQGRIHHQSFQPSPRMEATDYLDAHKSSLKAGQSGKRAVALPHHRECIYMFIASNKPANRGASEATSSHLLREWLVGQPRAGAQDCRTGCQGG